MNRLIIIGNGFDLAHGLKTRYSDFMLDYLKKILIEIRKPKDFNVAGEEIYSDELIKVGFSKTNLHYIATPSDFNDCNNLKDLIKVCAEYGLQINGKTNFINEIVIGFSNDNWVDIENLYYQHILKIVKEYPNDGSDKVLLLRYLKLLNNQMTFLKEKLVEYLKKVDADFNFASILDSDFHYELESVFTENVRTYDKQARGTRIGSVIVLNFNYTNLIQKYCKRLKDQFYIDHIQLHGKLSQPESIVFGYGDEIHASYKEIEHLNENEFFEHIKSFKYFQNSDYQKLISFIEADTFEVYVLGHSLGLSDRTMFNNIFESKNLDKVQLYYYKNDSGSNDYTSKTHEISRHFNDKGRMRNKIVSFDRSKPMPQNTLPKS